jgi:hypothetical protein
MISLTHLKEVMKTASLSDEGRSKLDALIESIQPGCLILLEGHPVIASFAENPNSNLPFVILSAQDMAALSELRSYDSGIVLSAKGDGTPPSVVPMFIVYNDVYDEQQKYFGLDYQIDHTDEWRPAVSSGANAAEAIQNFAIDFSPEQGTVTAVRADEPSHTCYNTDHGFDLVPATDYVQMPNVAHYVWLCDEHLKAYWDSRSEENNMPAQGNAPAPKYETF